jgi:hypothetical protein
VPELPQDIEWQAAQFSQAESATGRFPRLTASFTESVNTTCISSANTFRK